MFCDLSIYTDDILWKGVLDLCLSEVWFRFRFCSCSVWIQLKPNRRHTVRSCHNVLRTVQLKERICYLVIYFWFKDSASKAALNLMILIKVMPTWKRGGRGQLNCTDANITYRGTLEPWNSLMIKGQTNIKLVMKKFNGSVSRPVTCENLVSNTETSVSSVCATQRRPRLIGDLKQN